jgi:hypothetical protein
LIAIFWATWPIAATAYVLTGGSWPDNDNDGRFEISYSYSNLFVNSPNPHNGVPPGAPLGGALTNEDLRQAILEALNLWASVSPLDFREVVDSGPPIDQHRHTDIDGDGNDDDKHDNYLIGNFPRIRIGHHPIDMAYGTLAHGFFPPDINLPPFWPVNDGLTGDVHFDTAETWNLSGGSAQRDFLEVALHEIGHALGLKHEIDTDDMGPDVQETAIMNPNYADIFDGLGTSRLYPDDVQGIRRIYGSGTGTVRSLGLENSRVWATARNGHWHDPDRWSGAPPTSSELARFNQYTDGNESDYTVVIDRYTASDGLQVDRGTVTIDMQSRRYDINGIVVLGGDWNQNGFPDTTDPAYLSLNDGEVYAASDVQMHARSVFNVEESIVRVAGSIEDDGGRVEVRRGSLYVADEVTVQAEDRYDAALEIGGSGHVSALVVTAKHGGTIEVNGGSMSVQHDLGFGLATNGANPYGSLSLSNGGRIDVARHARISVDLIFEIGEVSPLLNVAGQMILENGVGGRSSLTAHFDPAFTPMVNDSFNLFDFGDVAGTFKFVNLPQLPSGLRWDQSRLYINGTLSIALQGDFNLDGTVDAADYVVWRNLSGQAGAGLVADGNGDGMVDGDDYQLWKSHFGQTAGSGAALPSAEPLSAGVPEPNAAVLLAICVVSVSCFIRTLPLRGRRDKDCRTGIPLIDIDADGGLLLCRCAALFFRFLPVVSHSSPRPCCSPHICRRLWRQAWGAIVLTANPKTVHGNGDRHNPVRHSICASSNK